MSPVAKIIKDSQVRDSGKTADTIRLWESHREQASLWRAIALIQVPATLLALILSFVLWSTRSITLNVPAKPLPGIYAAQDIPDTEFIETATNFINLIATYQPAVADRQYQEARKMLWEPALDRFDREMIGDELKAIMNTRRTQIFFMDPTKTKIERGAREVLITLSGDRYKLISGKDLPSVQTTFIISMTIVPRNALNQYGIVVTNFVTKNEQI